MKKLHNNESGLIAIVVTMILMFILSLIVIAFSRITIRSERQAVDRQLNTQAFYAAETGINDGIDALNAELKKPSSLLISAGINNCNGIPPTIGNGPYSKVIDAAGAISYTCLLIDTSPNSLVFSNIAKNSTKLVPIEKQDGTGIGSVAVYWQDPTVSTGNFSGCPSSVSQLPQAWAATCDSGMLEVSLVPITGAFNNASLINNTMSVYATPPQGGRGVGTVSYLNALGFNNGQGAIVSALCEPMNPKNPRNCSLKITNLSATKYYNADYADLPLSWCNDLYSRLLGYERCFAINRRASSC